MSHTGLELYRGTLKCFTNRNDPITRNYQHTHGKVVVTKRPSQLFFFLEENDIELMVQFPEVLSALLPSRHLWLLSGPSSLKFSTEVCWAISPKRAIGNDLSKVKKWVGIQRQVPWALMPMKCGGGIYIQTGRDSTLPAQTSYRLRVTLWSWEDDFVCQKEENCAYSSKLHLQLWTTTCLLLTIPS